MQFVLQYIRYDILSAYIQMWLHLVKYEVAATNWDAHILTLTIPIVLMNNKILALFKVESITYFY